jgi:hypothetical protein
MRGGKKVRIGNERGSVLVVTLLIMFAVGVMGATLAVISSMDLKISGNQRVTTQALDVSEAGLNEAIHRLSLANPTNATIGGWTGNIAIGDPPPYDPNWEARLYLTDPGSAPSPSGSIVTTGTIQDPNGTYLQYSRPSGTDDLLTIRHKWRDRNGDGTKDANEVVRYDTEQIPPENFTSGYPVEIVTVTGRMGQAERMIQAEVTKRKLTARCMAALLIDKPIRINGNPAICGYNHRIGTPVGIKPAACFAWHEGSGNLPGVATTGDEIDVKGGSADIEGEPTPTDSSSSNPFYSLAETLGLSQDDLNQLLANADNTSITNPLNGITYLTGDQHVNSNIVGSGLIYCTGDLNVNGTFDFKGLIYIEGDAKINGTFWALGAIIVRGKTSYNTNTGNAAILYSAEAISQALGQYMPMIVLSWREL